MWEFSLDSIKLVYFKNGKQKKMNIITPQAAIIENVIERAIHLETKANRPNHAAEDEVSTTPAYPLGGIMKHSSSGLLRQSSMVRSSQVSRTNSQNRTSQVDRFAHRISEVAQGSGARRLSVARGIREQRAMTYVASNDFQRVGAVGIINKEEVLQDDNY